MKMFIVFSPEYTHHSRTCQTGAHHSCLPLAIRVSNKSCQLHQSVGEGDGVLFLEAVLAVNVKETSHLLSGITGQLVHVGLTGCRLSPLPGTLSLAVEALLKTIVSLLWSCSSSVHHFFPPPRELV